MNPQNIENQTMNQVIQAAASQNYSVIINELRSFNDVIENYFRNNFSQKRDYKSSFATNLMAQVKTLGLSSYGYQEVHKAVANSLSGWYDLKHQINSKRTNSSTQNSQKNTV